MRPRRRPNDRARSRMPLGLVIALVLGVVVAATAALGAALWLTLGRPPIRQVSGWTTANSFEFAKVVLAIVGGAGAVVALVVAYRKQRLSEVADQREDIKLFAERFTKASEQLGSDKAPVRLAGMYALEDLGQGTPGQRQTIVNVLCAYLRMPYLPPVAADLVSSSDVSANSEAPTGTGDASVAADPASVDQAENERRYQEREVRLTAQRILAVHLDPGDTPEQPVDTYWSDIDLDLTGATLHRFDLSMCRVRAAQFDGTRFVGDAWFRGAHFDGDAWFGGARFGGDGTFSEARFGGKTGFFKAWFDGGAYFGETRFDGAAYFDGTWFGEGGWFVKARFDGEAGFGGARFDWDARFSEVRFGGDAIFTGAEFSAGARFDGAQFDRSAEFEKVRVRLDEQLSEQRIWPNSLVEAEPAGDKAAQPPAQDGKWGFLSGPASTTIHDRGI